MKILVLGNDGYIGYSLTLHLLNEGHEVTGIDNGSRRARVRGVGSDSLTPIQDRVIRNGWLEYIFEGKFKGIFGSLGYDSIDKLVRIINESEPECIVHLAEQPSAPWSMKGPQYASLTQSSNVIGTLDLLWVMKKVCPDAHLVKIGTMGEYGTPNCDIPEGFIPNQCLSHGIGPYERGIEVDCPMSGLLFPRQPGSFYHLSKVHDTFNIKFACDNWGLRSTDIMQGVVFGVTVTGKETEEELTRFDYDEYFGTAINRFCTQAIIKHPLTVYGGGHQIRGFLPLKDSIQCLNIAINNPPNPGEYRTWNQFENIYSINTLADMVCRGAYNLGIKVGINHIDNPRKEAEEHYYNPVHQKLFDLGYVPTRDIQTEIESLLYSLIQYRDKVIKDVIMPTTTWT